MNELDGAVWPRLFAGAAVWALILAAPFAAGDARAEPPDGPAKTKEDLTKREKTQFLEFLKAGNDAYENGEFEKALPFFERAYDILPKPVIHYKMGLAHERAGNPKEAIQYYRRFLEQRPDSDKRGKVEESIQKLQDQVDTRSTADVRVESTPANADVFVRAGSAEKRELEPRGRTPVTLTVVPGTVEITLEKEGYETIREAIRVEPGETYHYSYTLPAQGGSGGPRRSRGSKTVSLVATVIGGAGALVGGTLYAVGLHCGRNRKNCSRSLFNTAAIGSYVGGGLGVAGLGTAAIIGLTDDSSPRARAPATNLRLMLSPGFIGISGRF